MCQTSPTGMGSGDKAAVHIGKQNWQAICHHDGAGKAGLSGHTRVCHRAIGRLRRQVNDISTVHLLQKHGARTDV